MIEEEFNLEEYLSNGVEQIIKKMLAATLRYPRENMFLARYARASINARRRREKAEENGKHIPPFLIASITNQCNLKCSGCYANNCQVKKAQEDEELMSVSEWVEVFSQAHSLGIVFILLAGGEPLLRREVIKAAAKFNTILFPIFTNGTLLDSEYVKLFEKRRNLFPVFSLEGEKNTTDGRRGKGIYDGTLEKMNILWRERIIFGVSVTVTKKNADEVTSKEFLNRLDDWGCKVVFYIGYVPVEAGTENLVLDVEGIKYFNKQLAAVRERYINMIFLNFPGDEKIQGGCMAAGRGFFHISAHGFAEPCPFSPNHDTSLRLTTLENALDSPLFTHLRDNNMLQDDYHKDGCVLFEKNELVKLLTLN